MADLQNEMDKLRSEVAEHAIVRDAERVLNQQQTEAATVQLTQLFQQICMDIAKNPDISVTSPNTKTPGFSVSLTNSLDPAQLPFNVKATCTGGQVEIEAADGKWDSASNVHGNWGGWSDDQILFRGPMNETKIRKAVSTAFLNWYQHAISR